MVAHAYDADLAERSRVDEMLDRDWQTPENYAKYPPTGEPYHKSIIGKIYNFYNPDDYALELPWKANQDLKPNAREHYRVLAFNLELNSGYYECTKGFNRRLHFPPDAFEAYAHCAGGRSTALGEQSSGKVRGNFNVNSGWSRSAYRFGDQREGHSAQFRATNMIRHEFWEKLLSEECFNIRTSRAAQEPQ